MSNLGGYRKGSGRSKSGYYKEIYCGSTYELCWVIYSLENGIKFDRFQGKLEKNGVVYYPDFLLDDGKTIIETKGYEKEDSVNKKTKVAESFGYNVKILRKKDLQYAFDYVYSIYKTRKYYELYDNYKPKYSHVCNCCKLMFETDRKIKTETKFCNRECAGRYRNSINCISNDVKNKISITLTGKKINTYKRKYKQIWITNGITNTRIKDGDLIPNGWNKGRITAHR